MPDDIAYVSVKDFMSPGISSAVELPFNPKGYTKNEKEEPRAFITLSGAGSMRFRWNETNSVRNSFFSAFLSDSHKLFPLELIHSQDVFSAAVSTPWENMRGDGIITSDPLCVPVITAADCMPVYLFNPVSFCFGVLHSGWKGTGIIRKALELAKKKYGAKAEDFHVILGPHIQSCCYTVEEERASYFAENFGASCITRGENEPPRLSLLNANLTILEHSGIPENHIACFTDCTCCSKNEGRPYLGSFRRETQNLLEKLSIEEKSRYFTPMAAFMYMK